MSVSKFAAAMERRNVVIEVRSVTVGFVDTINHDHALSISAVAAAVVAGGPVIQTRALRIQWTPRFTISGGRSIYSPSVVGTGAASEYDRFAYLDEDELADCVQMLDAMMERAAQRGSDADNLEIAYAIREELCIILRRDNGEDKVSVQLRRYSVTVSMAQLTQLRDVLNEGFRRLSELSP
jgi:hypothetical protein